MKTEGGAKWGGKRCPGAGSTTGESAHTRKNLHREGPYNIRFPSQLSVKLSDINLTMEKHRSLRPKFSVFEDATMVFLFAVIAYISVWLLNAAIDVHIFHKGSFLDALLLRTTEFNTYYRLSTLAFFLLYGVIAAKIISRRRIWGEQLLHSKEKMQALLGAIPDSLYRIRSDGTLLESFSEKRGNSPATGNEHPGEKIETFIPGDIARNIMVQAGKTLETAEMHCFEYQLPRDGEVIHYETRMVPTGKNEVLAIFRDITARKMLEEELRTLLLIDDLTELHNRRGFFVLARQQFKLSARTKQKMLLLYMDIDGMKEINDRFGHMEGDRALRETANIIKETLRKSDITARISGDEFVALMINVADMDVQTIIRDRLTRAFNELNATPGRTFKLSVSIGSARYEPENPRSIEELLSSADRTMYEDKKRKKIPGAITL